jgi:hypothetical protein
MLLHGWFRRRAQAEPPASLPMVTAPHNRKNISPGMLQMANILALCYCCCCRRCYCWQDGYDHSYFFISSFVDEHINFHADALSK